MRNKKRKKSKNSGTMSTEYFLIAVITGIALIAACKNLGLGLKNNVKSIGETIEKADPYSDEK